MRKTTPFFCALGLLCCGFLEFLQARAETTSGAEDVVRRIEASLAKPSATGILLTFVEYGSQAHAHGFQPGDILLSYGQQKPKSIAHLIELVQKVGEVKEVEVLRLAQGKQEKTMLEPGRIGVDGIYVEAGKAVDGRPKVAPFQSDFSALGRFEEAWFAFLQDGEKIGYERQRLSRQDDLYQFEARSVFGPEDGLTDMHVQVDFKAEKGLPFRRFRYSWGGGEFQIAFDRNGEKLNGSVGDEKVAWDAPKDVLPSYCTALLAATLPLEPGVGTHLTVLGEGNATFYYGSVLVCRGQEETEISGKKVRAWRFEQSSFGKVGNTYWLDDGRKLLKVRFRPGAEIHRAAKDEVLHGLPEAITKTLADDLSAKPKPAKP